MMYCTFAHLCKTILAAVCVINSFHFNSVEKDTKLMKSLFIDFLRGAFLFDFGVLF